MNQNCEQIWNRAAQLAATFPSGNNSWEAQKLFVETIIKLTAEECAAISDSSFHNGSAGYLAIKNYFGITT